MRRAPSTLTALGLAVVLAAGSTTPIDLVGDLPGVWEVELHGSGGVLAELEVGG